jgi:hypothetical protein
MKACIVADTAINLTLMQALVRKIDGCEAVYFREAIPGLQYCIDAFLAEMDGVLAIRARYQDQLEEE